MRVPSALVSLLLLASVAGASSHALAKESKGAKKAMKECTDKGGKWDKKKKSCQVEAKTQPAAETAPAPAPETAPAPASEGNSADEMK